jgi:hypothetical protein
MQEIPLHWLVVTSVALAFALIEAFDERKVVSFKKADIDG